jgi:hypothetical protein
MDGRKILGVLRLRARQLKSVGYPGGAALRMTGTNILLEHKFKDLLHPAAGQELLKSKHKVPPSYSRAGKSARSLNGRRDDEL